MHMARRTVSRTVLVAVCALAVIAGFLVYRWWNDPLDDACGGSLSTVLVPDALGGDEATAQSADGDGEGAMARCRVRNTASPDENSFTLDIRRVERAGDEGALLPARTSLYHATDAVGPLGDDWSGTTSRRGSQLRAAVTVPCGDEGSDADDLLVSGLLEREDAAAAEEARAVFARVTADTAQNAAEIHGCPAPQVKEATRLSQIRVDPLSAKPRPLTRATGTCAALRPLAERAEAAGVPTALEAATTGKAPAEDCYLAENGSAGSPGYRVSALYGPYARILRTSDGSAVSEDAGTTEKNHLAWASAKCEGSSERALFVLWGIRATGGGTVAEHPSPAFEKDALTAFAKRSAKAHGCSDLRLP
ncbi:hypothetical protein ACWGJ2_32715 [Streptomyces sp. NPDC054796]